MQRRTFLQISTAAAALGFARAGWALPSDHRYMQSLGLQLYTVRHPLAEDPQAAMERIAQVGYKQVELMDVVADQQIAKIATDQGLKITSAFFDWRVVVDPKADGVPTVDKVIEAAQELGLRYLVFGYIGAEHRKTVGQYHAVCESANAVADKIRAAGMRMCYHNHAFEFEPLADEKMGFEIFLERFDKDLVSFELDVFWAAIGGWSPVEILRRMDGRVTQLHLKDLKPGTGTMYDESMVPEGAFQEVGDGSIDFQQLIAVAEQVGVEQCHVEQDQSTSPLESIAQSYNYLRDLQLP